MTANPEPMPDRLAQALESPNLMREVEACRDLITPDSIERWSPTDCHKVFVVLSALLMKGYADKREDDAMSFFVEMGNLLLQKVHTDPEQPDLIVTWHHERPNGFTVHHRDAHPMLANQA